MEIGSIFTKGLTLFTLFGNAFVVALILLYFLARPIYERVMRFMSDHALTLGLFFSASSTIGSIIYSEVVGFPACILCWMQRIFMYPMMFLFGMGLFRKERNIIPYAMMLAIIGGVVAFYQWSKDMLALYSSINIPCPAVSSLPSCDKIYVLEYGYITIPMIALNAFILITIIMYAALRAQKHDN